MAPLTRKTDIVLIGGQALAFWSARFAEPSGEISVVASKDIDFEGECGRSPHRGDPPRRESDDSVTG